MYEPEGRKLKGTRANAEGMGDGAGVRLWRIGWLVLLMGQAALASAWWWLSPGGYGPGHPRTWLNRVAMPAVVLAAIASLWVLHRGRTGPLRLALAAWASAWAGAIVALSAIFPITLGGLGLLPSAFVVAIGLASAPFVWDRREKMAGPARWLLSVWPTSWSAAAVLLGCLGLVATRGPRIVPAAIAFGAVLAAVRPWRAGPTGRRQLAAVAATVCASALAGAAMAMALKPPAADTHPLDVPIAIDPPAGPEADPIRPGFVRLDDDSVLRTTDGTMVARVPPLSIRVEPLLTFLSQSPDGLPVAMLTPRERIGPEPRFFGGRRTGDRSCWLGYLFPGQGPANLRALLVPKPRAIELEAITKLDHPIYSHLNTFCDVVVDGHRRLSLAFSPCPGDPVEVRHFEYPNGAPSRFAFVEADRTFRVVEASEGEKGPFRTLARGRLLPDERLTITLHDQGRPVARLTLDDFAAQADTTPSPTAGWGVPANAIEFSLAEEAPSSPASIFITLAGTSIGRGWDCVAHRAGTYRNRVRLEAAAGAITPKPSAP